MSRRRDFDNEDLIAWYESQTMEEETESLLESASDELISRKTFFKALSDALLYGPVFQTYRERKLILEEVDERLDLGHTDEEGEEALRKLSNYVDTEAT